MAKYIAKQTEIVSYAARISYAVFNTDDGELWRELVEDNPDYDPDKPSDDPDIWLELLQEDPDRFEFHDYDVSEHITDVEYEVEESDEDASSDNDEADDEDDE
jgi:hypothetical protein